MLQCCFFCSFCRWPPLLLRTMFSTPDLVFLFSTVYRQVVFGMTHFTFPFRCPFQCRQPVAVFFQSILSSFSQSICPIHFHLLIFTSGLLYVGFIQGIFICHQTFSILLRHLNWNVSSLRLPLSSQNHTVTLILQVYCYKLNLYNTILLLG